MQSSPSAQLKSTPLSEAHISAGAKMVPFAGYSMPVQYRDGVLKEHIWTRTQAGLFDVSHMGQATVVAADGKHETVARALEQLLPADLVNLAPGRQRYSQLLTQDGGIIDDLMISRSPAAADEGRLLIVVNAARKDFDYDHIRAHLAAGVTLEMPDRPRALIALQGPAAQAVAGAAGLANAHPLDGFMQTSFAKLAGADCYITRSGYTGEDGFEISVAAADAAAVWAALAGDERVRPIGLGARDSLRLEAGLCLYGHDIDETTSPIEAGLTWSIQKRRRRDGGFPGDERIQRELEHGPARKRVGIKPDGRAPAREGTEIRDASGAIVGAVTSGGFGPTLNGPVAMGYVTRANAAAGTALTLVVRGKDMPATVVDMPFVPNRFKRTTKAS